MNGQIHEPKVVSPCKDIYKWFSLTGYAVQCGKGQDFNLFDIVRQSLHISKGNMYNFLGNSSKTCKDIIGPVKEMFLIF